MSKSSVKNNLVTSRRIRIFFLGLFLCAASCGKYENDIVDTSYSRSDVAAAQAAFTVINSNLMATENNFLSSTCTNAYMNAKRAVCNDDGNGGYDTKILFDACTFNNGTIRVVPYNGVLSPWLEKHENASCSIPALNNQVINRSFDDLATSTTKEKVKYSMPNQDTVEFDNDGATLSGGNVMGTSGINIKQESATQRSFAIDSVHVLRRNNENETLYSVYVKTTHSTSYDLTVDGALADETRLANGFVFVHNGANERIKTNFQSVKWGSAACCYPTQGSMLLQFETGPNVGQTATVNFKNYCGSAEITGVNGQKSALNFTECY